MISSKDWDQVDMKDKKRLEYKPDHDGEFWLVSYILIIDIMYTSEF
jgi:hypothetical protein